MIRSLTTSAIAATLFTSLAAQATELSFTGSVDAGYTADLNTFENTPKSKYNLEANLGMEAKLTDMVSAHVYVTSWTGMVPTGFDNGARWPGLAYDGVDLTWKLSEDQTVVVGDFVVAKGSISYYTLKRYSAVTRVAAIRGASYSMGGLFAYAGADDATDSLFTAGASYLFAIDSMNSIEPSAIVHAGGKDNLSWGGGMQYKGKFGALSVSASAAAFGGKNSAGDDKIGYVLAAEPVYTTDAFYVAGFALFAPTGKDSTHSIFTYPVRHGRTYEAWAEDMVFYVEPGVNFAAGKAAFGLPIEYHEPDLDNSDNEKIAFVPSFYLYPAKDATITLWGEADVYTKKNKDPGYAVGLETVFKF